MRLKKEEKKKKRRSIQRKQKFWPWVVTLTLRQGKKSSSHQMSVIVLYLCIRYGVCGCDTVRDMTICSFFVTFDHHMWPSVSVKVTYLLTIKYAYRCMLVPSIELCKGNLKAKKVQGPIPGSKPGGELNSHTRTSSWSLFSLLSIPSFGWDVNWRPRVNCPNGAGSLK